MSNLGVGIGSFMEGFAKSYALKRQMDRQEADDELQRRKLDLLEKNSAFEQGIEQRRLGIQEEQNARQRKFDEFNLKKGQSEFDYLQKERAAEAPLKNAERTKKLNALKDDEEQRQTFRSAATDARKGYEAQRAKSILVGKDPTTGAPTYIVDGEKAASKEDADKLFETRHGTMMDAYNNTMVPRITEGYLKRGDYAGAQAFQKWNQMEGIQKGVSDYGRMMQSFELGDWDGATKHINSMLSNGDYFNRDRHDLKVEPIKEGGKTAGVRMTYKDKVTNAESTREFKNMQEFQQMALKMAAPDSVFELNRAEMEAARKAEAERAGEKEKAALDITKERAKSDMRMDEERLKSALDIEKELAKEGGPTGDKRRADGVRDVWKSLNETNSFVKEDENGNQAPMSAQEQIDLAKKTYDDIISQTRRRAQAGATPVARSIMPEQAMNPAPAAPVAPVPQPSAPAVAAQPGAPVAAPPPARRVLPPLFTYPQGGAPQM